MFMYNKESRFLMILILFLAIVIALMSLAQSVKADPIPRNHALVMAELVYGRPYDKLVLSAHVLVYLWACPDYARAVMFTYNPKLNKWAYTHEVILDKPHKHIKTIYRRLLWNSKKCIRVGI